MSRVKDILERMIDSPTRARRILWRVAGGAFAASAGILMASGWLAERTAEGLPTPRAWTPKKSDRSSDPQDFSPIWTARLGDPPPPPAPSPEPAAPAPVQVDLRPLLSSFKLVACAPHSTRSRSSCMVLDRRVGKQALVFVGDPLGDSGLRLADVSNEWVIFEKDGQAVELRMANGFEAALAKLGGEASLDRSPGGPPRFTRDEVLAYFRSREWRNKEPFGIQQVDTGKRDGTDFERWLGLSPGSVIMFLNGDPVYSSATVVSSINQKTDGTPHELILRTAEGKHNVVFVTKAR